MTRMKLPVGAVLILFNLSALAAGEDEEASPLTRIALGSCARQKEPQPIWDSVVKARPDLFLFLGDNIYGDSRDMDVLRAKYAQLAEKPGFQKLRAACPILAVWDDHDYGALRPFRLPGRGCAFVGPLDTRQDQNPFRRFRQSRHYPGPAVRR